jgi:hypothetical protein
MEQSQPKSQESPNLTVFEPIELEVKPKRKTTSTEKKKVTKEPKVKVIKPPKVVKPKQIKIECKYCSKSFY